MSETGNDLQTPILLMAMPQVLDPYFHRSVVLLAHHEAEGSLGFIVNKPTEIHIAEILKGMEISWGGASEAMAYFGGPVQPQVGSVLYDPSRCDPSFEAARGGSEVLPGLFITRNVDDLQALAAQPTEGFRLCLGYAGWGEGQLMEEILRNDWLTAPATEELIFDSDPATIWDRALRSVGVEPQALASWAPAGSEGAN